MGGFSFFEDVDAIAKPGSERWRELTQMTLDLFTLRRQPFG
jgi:hypothetical protein